MQVEVQQQLSSCCLPRRVASFPLTTSDTMLLTVPNRSSTAGAESNCPGNQAGCGSMRCGLYSTSEKALAASPGRQSQTASVNPVSGVPSVVCCQRCTVSDVLSFSSLLSTVSCPRCMDTVKGALSAMSCQLPPSVRAWCSLPLAEVEPPKNPAALASLKIQGALIQW